MESSEKILNNCDALEAIFRYLDFDEHLKLIKISPQFENAIGHGVWRCLCKNLHIRQEGQGTFRLQYNAVNDVVTERSLTPEAVHIILHHSSMYIQKLELDNMHHLESIISFKYHNLTELTLFGTIVEDIHLQQVAKNCKNLQSLTLLSFTKSEIQSNIRVNVFDEMKCLNKLEIVDTKFTAWNYFDVQQLFCLPHLKTLIVNIRIHDSNDKQESNNNSTDRVYNIEDLTIGAHSGNKCFTEDLIRFKNLTKLGISPNIRTGNLDDNFLTQINSACPQLCKLSLRGFSVRVKELPRMNNLEHLTFIWCYDMKFKLFEEIFRKLKLKSLTLLCVEIDDEAEDTSDYNLTSNTLETLSIIFTYNAEKILEIFFNPQHTFENVSKIKLEKRLPSEGLCFSHNFPNVQELILDFFYISSEDILHLEHLKVLEFVMFNGISWPYFEILFQHPTLTHIIIHALAGQNYGIQYERLPECCEALTTTLEYLSLPSIVYKSALDFWPSFRQRNKLLKLEVVGCDI